MSIPRSQHRRRRSSTVARQSSLRIIGGQWRGRQLPIATVEGLRPTGDRIRETLFNWLQGELLGACCLDVFAGSGALGFECLSRGAAAAYLLEAHPKAVGQLRENSRQLQANHAHIIEADALAWLAQAPLQVQSVNLAFIDPPFAKDLWQPTIKALEQSQLLAGDAAIYIETPKHYTLTTPAHWQLDREKYSGDVCYRLYRL